MGSLNDVSSCCNFAMNQLFQPGELVGVSNEYIHKQKCDDLTILINKCVSYGESNSILVIGPRGCGKNYLINQSLRNVMAKGKEQASVVYLNGLLQTDDNLALEETTRQLKLENVADEMVFGSFEERLQFLLQSLKTGTKNSQPVVFVLDEFHMFAEHKNQTLLYNLFDIAQTRQTPICVIGLTCRLDVTELLEKRVKSRFSHRYIYLFDQLTFPTLLTIFTSYLKLPSNSKKDSFAYKWNRRMDELLLDPQIKDLLLFRFNMVTDIHSIKQLAALIIGNCTHNDSNQLPEQKNFLEAFKILNVDCKGAILQGTSIIELSLIIAMKQLTEIYSDEPFNFQMVYEHYRKFCERKSSTKACAKAIALKAFEHLIDLEIVKPADHSLSVLKQYRPMRLLVTSNEIDDAVLHYSGCPSDVKQWSYSDCIRA